MDENILEKTYREELDEQIIGYMADLRNIPLDQAMSIYYHSRMADMIGNGEYGIQYLDYKVLVDMMLQNEPALFEAT